METDDKQVEGHYEVNLDDDMNTIPTEQLDGGNVGDHGYAWAAGDAAFPPVLRDGDFSVSDAGPVSTRPRRLPSLLWTPLVRVSSSALAPWDLP